MEEDRTESLPPNVTRILTELVEAARRVFGVDLRSVVLYGSAAEGRMRRTSDVNVILFLSKFDEARAAQLREPLRVARATIRLSAMFLLASELQAAMDLFAVKFGDIARRHRVLFGEDPFADLSVSRAAAIARLKQTLLNITLRMREAYVARGLREEQLSSVIADSAAPLRACAAALLEVEGTPAASPKEALARFVESIEKSGDGLQSLTESLSRVSEAREEGRLPPGTAGPTLLKLIDLAGMMWQRAEALA